MQMVVQIVEHQVAKKILNFMEKVKETDKGF